MQTKFWLAGALSLVVAAPALADGNVSAAVVEGELRILGDGSANDLEVTPGGELGTYVVTGRNGTTVNSAASASFSRARALLVDLNSGDDVLALTNITLRRDLRVRLDDGNDVLVMTSVQVNGRAAVKGGLGNDQISAGSNCNFRSTLAVNGGDGADDVILRDCDFNNRVRVDGKAGDDHVEIHDSDFNSLARLEIEGRRGADELVLEGCTFNNDVAVDLGKDDDRCEVADCDFNRDADFSGGGGGSDDMDLRSGNDFRDLPGIHSFEE